MSTPRFRSEAVLGAIAAIATAACYSIGSGRAFDYDGSVTVVLFIRAPISAAIRGQYVFNNHPYFSLLEQFVWRITGSSSETTLRLLPMACAATTVGILGFVVSRRWGLLAGGSAAAIVAANPVFIQEGREVRGYSLMVLCAVVSSCILWSRERLPWHRSVYVAAMGLGLGTHLFMFVVLAIHVVVVAASHRMSRSWACRWASATAIGSVPYLFEFRELFGRPHPRAFHPTFPLTATRDLLGHEWLAVAITGCLVVLALWQCRHNLALVGAGAVVVLAMAATWVVAVQEGSRFFLWLVPAVGVGVGAVVARRAAAALLVAVACAAAVTTVLPTFRSDDVGNRAAAPIITTARREGLVTCGLGGATETLPVYVGDIPEVFDPSLLRRCDVVVDTNPAEDPALLASVRGAFPYRTVLPAVVRGVVLSKFPLASR